MLDRLERAINNHRIQTNVDVQIGQLANAPGSTSNDPRLRDGSGRMWILFQGATFPVALPLDTNANIPPMVGIAVEVGMVRGAQSILRAYRSGLLQSGANPNITNPSDPQVKGDTPTSDITQFRCMRSADSSKPWTVVVESGYREIEDVSYIFFESELDLSGFVPSAGEKCIACVYVESDMTLVAYTSTPVMPSDPITPAMIDECRQQAADDAMSDWLWVLEGDASKLSSEITKNQDLRPFFARDSSSGGGGGGSVTVGTYAASRPATPAEGDLYLPTDGRFNEVYHSSTWQFNDSGKIYTKPSDLSWAWINQSAATIQSTAGVEHLYTSTNAGGQNLNIRKRTAPSAPYAITVRLRPSQIQEAGAQMGLCFRESGSGKLAGLGFYFAAGSLPVIFVNNYTNATTVAASITSATLATVPEWLRIEDNNTNRIMSYSYDGIIFTPFYTVSRTTFITADEVGYFINPFAIASQIDLTVLAWIET